jgi:hypothetical protein
VSVVASLRQSDIDASVSMRGATEHARGGVALPCGKHEGDPQTPRSELFSASAISEETSVEQDPLSEDRFGMS